MREGCICAPAERSTTKDELVNADAEGPPVDGIGVSSFGEDFGGHVRHGARYASEHSSFGEMNGDIKVGKMGMATLVEKNVVWFDISGDSGVSVVNT